MTPIVSRISRTRLRSPRAALLVIATATLAWSDGFIVIPPDRPTNRDIPGFPLEVRYHHVDVTIQNMSALTAIDQEFYNPTGRRLEGTYIFPIPEGAVIDKFSMFIDGKEVQAEMLDATRARTIYEDIVRRMIDPALLEYYGKALFKARIFPIEPNGAKRVKISYRQTLDRDNGAIGYVYPLNTEKFSAAPVREVSVRVSIAAGDAIKNVYSPTHEVDIVRKDPTHATVSFEAHDVKPDRDFGLYYTTASPKFGLSLLTHAAPGEDGYVFLNVSPALSTQEIDEKDVTFVLDVSGSMAGAKMEQARKSLLFCIANLNPGDRFEIIRFSTEAQALFGALTRANRPALDKAREFVSSLRPIGGTNIEEALDMALRGGDGTRRHTVLFVTDGKPTIGQTDETALLDAVKRSGATHTRIFTLGIGDDLNTHLLDGLTDLTHAYRTYVKSGEDLEVKLSDLYAKLQSPVLTDVKIEVTGGVRLAKTYPRELPDLFHGSSLTVLGRFTGTGTAVVVLSGMLRGTPRRFTYDCTFSSSATGTDFIPPLWAARRVGYLLDQIRLHGQDKEIVDECTSLARQYGIITPYTSYLILEDEAAQVSTRRMRAEDGTLGLMAPRAAAPAMERRMRESFDAMKQKSGGAGVRASADVQGLSRAENMATALKDDESLSYTDASGAERALSQQIKHVLGHAMYNTGSGWVDPRVQSMKSPKTRRIQYGSPEYFALLAKNPECAGHLSLGKNVKFVLGGEIVEVRE